MLAFERGYHLYMDKFINKSSYSFDDLVKIMELLRSESGCPWDREQTHNSLVSCTIEEAYEVVEAINNNDVLNLREELGDLLLQVVFHSKIANDNNNFNIDDVINEIVNKLIRRHPHVFGDKNKSINEDEVIETWDAIKKTEKEYITYSDQLKSVPKALPALIRAWKVQKKASKVGFDFNSFNDAFNKIGEELEEVKEAYEMSNIDKLDEEIGDLFFSVVNISRFLKINAENSLTNAIEKFINRFEGVEQLAVQKGLVIENMSIEELDALWEKVKVINSNRENDC
jgi:tetrapyrrole methylase family protein/MazG family protein